MEPRLIFFGSLQRGTSQGFYARTDDYFAFGHGSGHGGIMHSPLANFARQRGSPGLI
jgi:hypothetical protein